LKKLRLLSLFFIIIFNKSTVPQEDFTLILLPDTQYESSTVYNSQTQWIVDNKNSQSIVFVTHVGDIVDVANSTGQWNKADAAMDKLDAGNVPYSVGPGNHDLPIYSSPSYYNNYFGISRFSGKPWYGGYYGSDNYNNYSLFNASGLDFILINLQYDPTIDVLDWADGLLKAYPNRRGILECHDILQKDNSWMNPNTYIALKDNPNLFLMVCGHDWSISDGAAYREELGADGHTIHIMLADYQGFDLLGNGGYLRILGFSPKNNKIYVTTYSPYKNRYITSYPDQMEMDYNMASSKVLVETKFFLEGPYDSETDLMTTNLKSNNSIPANSPYAEDPRTAAVPANITDWVLLQLRSIKDGSAIASKSVFLRKDGQIVADDGLSNQVELNASPGSYYVVLKHRNHLAVMSNSAISFSSPPTVTSYDFTTGSNKFYGGSAGAVELESNIWGMIAGDANGNGQIQNNDSENYWKPDNGTAGYKNSDFNMNGQIQNNDNENYWKPNNGRGSQVPKL
jgi:hypothetical protein